MKYVAPYIMCLLLSLTKNLKVIILKVLLFECTILQYTEFAEADAFYCFSLIMIEIGDKFNKALDSSPTGYS